MDELMKIYDSQKTKLFANYLKKKRTNILKYHSNYYTICFNYKLPIEWTDMKTSGK